MSSKPDTLTGLRQGSTYPPRSLSTRAALMRVGLLAATSLGMMQAGAETLYLLTPDNKLATVSTATGSVATAGVTITGINAGETLVAIDVRPQNLRLYLLGVNASADTATLYQVDPRTSLATAVGTAPALIAFTTNGTTPVDLPDPATTKYDIDFNPAVDRLRVVAGSLNFRVDPNRGLPVDGDNGGGVTTGVNPDGAVNGGTTTVSAGAYTNNTANNGAITTLYTLDDASNSLFRQTPANSGTQVLVAAITLAGNPLDISLSTFDIAPGINAASSNSAVVSGTGILVSSVGGTSQVYSVDLVTGAATLRTTLALPNIRGSALRLDGDEAIALSSIGTSLLRFKPSTPGTVTTQAINTASLAAGEVLVGIDARPNTGQLYGLAVNATANTGTLYLIDPQTGALYNVGAQGSISFVVADGVTKADLPDPATTGYGFDFNPSVDRIRVTTGSGLNFRLNPNTGAPVDGDLGGTVGSIAGVNTDGTQTGGTVSGAAYTNSYGQGSGGPTTLYTLDAATNQLHIQNPPNAGTQTNALPVTLSGSPLDFTELGGFDIPFSVAVAASNTAATGDGWFVGTVGGTTSVYRIDLATGAATNFGAVGAGITPLGGFVIWSSLPDRVVENPSGNVVVSGASTVNFGAVATGDSTTRQIVLRNRGSSTLDYSIAATANPPFSVTTNGSGSIAGGASVTVTVAFSPTLVGSQSGTLTISSAGLSGFTIALEGVGALPQGNDNLFVTDGNTRYNPLANDPLPDDVVITAVSDPAISIAPDGRTLIIPSTYNGTFTYTSTNGTDTGVGSVTVVAGTQNPTPRFFNGVLTDINGEIAAHVRVTISAKGTGSLRLITATGTASARVVFPVGVTTTTVATRLGALQLARVPGSMAATLSLPGGGGLFGGTLHAEVANATGVKYNLSLASIDPTLPGGGFATATVTRTGAVRLIGTLPDGNTVTTSTNLTDNGAMAFYTPLRVGVNPSGVLGGDLTLGNNATTDITGEFLWIKPPQGAGGRGTHLGGVDTILRANGSVYNPGQPLYTGLGTLALAGGDRPGEGTVVNVTGGVPTIPTGSVIAWKATPQLGTFTFSVSGPKAIKGKGVYLQKSHTAVGYFPGTTEGGGVILFPFLP